MRAIHFRYLILSIGILLLGCGRMSPQTSAASGGLATGSTFNEPVYSARDTSLSLTPADQTLLSQELGTADAGRLTQLLPQMSEENGDIQEASEASSQALTILSRMRNPQVQADFIALAKSLSAQMKGLSSSSPPSQWKAALQRLRWQIGQFIRKALSRLRLKKTGGGITSSP